MGKFLTGIHHSAVKRCCCEEGRWLSAVAVTVLDFPAEIRAGHVSLVHYRGNPWPFSPHQQQPKDVRNLPRNITLTWNRTWSQKQQQEAAASVCILKFSTHSSAHFTAKRTAFTYWAEGGEKKKAPALYTVHFSHLQCAITINVERQCVLMGCSCNKVTDKLWKQLLQSSSSSFLKYDLWDLYHRPEVWSLSWRKTHEQAINHSACTVVILCIHTRFTAFMFLGDYMNRFSYRKC